MNPTLRNRLIVAAGSGVLAIAAVLVNWFEGNRYVPYRDTGGAWTVCRGHTGKDVIPGKTYTEPECQAFEDADIKVADAGVKRVIAVPLNAWQEAALTDFVFNLGEGALRDSTMADDFNAGDYGAGCTQLARWIHGRVHGELVVLPGLVTRRDVEEELCLNWGNE